MMIISCLLFGVMASAQSQKVIEKEFEKFSTVKVQDKFVVRLVKAEKFSVRINVDERIAAHVQAYEKNGVLYLVLNEKGYTRELKKELRKKGAVQPVIEATVYMPRVNSLIFTDDVVVAYSDELKSDNFTLTASDDVKIQHLKVSCSTAEINVSRSADVTSDIKVGNRLYLETSNSAKISLVQNGGNAFVKQVGSSVVDLKATVQDVDLTISSSSEARISGRACTLTVNASGSSRTDAELMDVHEGYITMTSSSKCYVNVADKLKVNLTGGSMLTFKRTPAIEVDRIVNSTFIKADDPKRK
jgi:hypothetical protein